MQPRTVTNKKYKKIQEYKRNTGKYRTVTKIQEFTGFTGPLGSLTSTNQSTKKAQIMITVNNIFSHGYTDSLKMQAFCQPHPSIIVYAMHCIDS